MKPRSWRWFISLLLSLGVIALAVFEREQILAALETLKDAQPLWMVLALILSLSSFFCTSLIYDVALRSLGYRQIGMLRVYGMTLVALMLSQAVPAGGVASYAFLAQSLGRRSVPPGHAALLASLEAITYAISVLIMFGFGIGYLVIRSGIGAAESTSLIAVVVPVLLVGAALFLITRDQPTLIRWVLGAKNWLARRLHRSWSDEPALRLIEDVARGRELIVERPWVMVSMLAVELLSLIGHSMVLLFVLYSLGTSISPLAVIASFGIMMVTSTFNVLPGGGGTVEAVLALTLQSFGVGPVAIAAAVIFRLLNFWLMLLPAGLSYWLLMREPATGMPETTSS